MILNLLLLRIRRFYSRKAPWRWHSPGKTRTVKGLFKAMVLVEGRTKWLFTILCIPGRLPVFSRAPKMWKRNYNYAQKQKRKERTFQRAESKVKQAHQEDEQQKVIHKLGSEYLYVDVKTEREIQADTNPGCTWKKHRPGTPGSPIVVGISIWQASPIQRALWVVTTGP